MLLYLLHPLSWCIGLLLGALLLWKRTRIARSLSLAALLLLIGFGTPGGSEALERRLEDQYPDRRINELPQAQAIVVLGGTIHMPADRHPRSGLIDPSDRILEALRLYRAGRAPLVICAGGAFPEQSEAEVMGRLLEEWGVPAEAILLETRSHSTHENALFSREILREKGIQRILLVTSAIHMPRAAATFRKVGFEVTAAPADFHTGWGYISGLERWLPDGRSLSQSDAALKEWIGLWVYRMRGWA